MGSFDRNSRAVRFAAAIMLGVCAVTGCARNEKTESDEKPYTIGVVTKSRNSEYWMSVCSGMEKAGKDYGVSVKIISPDSESNDRMQKKMIHDLIRQDVDALAISPISSYDAPYLAEAEEAGIRIVAYDTKILAKGIPYIGIDNRKAGEELAANGRCESGRTESCVFKLFVQAGVGNRILVLSAGSEDGMCQGIA